MHFIVTTETSSSYGDLFFTKPIPEETQKAAQKVAELCYKVVPQTERYIQRLEEELQYMRETGTAYHFLILKEIHELSPKGILLRGGVSGSIISWLLGFCAVDPFKPELEAQQLTTPVEFVWGLPEQIKVPTISLSIDPQVRPLIQSRLDQCFGNVKSDDNLYFRFSMLDFKMPEFMSTSCLNALHTIAEKQISQSKKLFAEKNLTEEECYERTSLLQEMTELQSCDLPTLIRLWAYYLSDFEGQRRAADLEDPWFFTTKDELYAKLIGCGVSKPDATEIVKRGVWSTGKKREGYIALLNQYSVPQALISNFAKVRYLVDAAYISVHICSIMNAIVHTEK